MTRKEIENIPELIDFLLDESVLADSRTKVRKRLEEVCDLAIKTLEQEPCDKCVYSTKDGYCQYDDITETIPPLKPCDEFEPITPEEMQKCKDIVKKYTPKQEPCDTVSRGVFEQVVWERDVAIEQLKELGYELGQKIEPCEDCISKQAVDTLVDELARAISDERCGISRGRSTATIMRDICHLPPVTPKQKYGKWIDDGWYADGHSHKVFHCSECGHNVLGFKEDLSKFCPNCGAKMVEPQESEE